MNISKDQNNNLIISGITIELAELLRTAILTMTEKHKECRPPHEKLLRRLAIQIDNVLTNKNSYCITKMPIDESTMTLDKITYQANARGLDMRNN